MEVVDDFVSAAKGGATSISWKEWSDLLRRFNQAHEGTWAISSFCGYDNKMLLVLVIRQLLDDTVEGERQHQDQTHLFNVEAEALLAARILLRERRGSEKLMDDEALKVYIQAALEDGDGHAEGGYRVSLMALKCINNAIWDQPGGQYSFLHHGGFVMLVKLLQASRPAPVLYFATRILNVVGTSHVSAFSQLKREYDLLHIFSSVLAWCVRCKEPPFPGGEDRLKLMVQALQALFLLSARYTSEEREEALKGDNMRRLGYVLVDALQLDHGELDAFKAKLQVLNLLLDMPDAFADVLFEHGCLPRILQVVELQLTRQAFEEGAGMDVAAELTPCLLVLNKLIMASEDVRVSVKKAVFPPEADEAWKRRMEVEQEKLRYLVGEEREHAEQAMKERQVHPADAPRGSLRARLFAQMTCTESSSKTAASDVLFNLCGNEEEFTTRCGFGNAVNTLRVKGRLFMPGVQ